MYFGSLYIFRWAKVQLMPDTQQLFGTDLLAVGAQFLAFIQSEALLTPQHFSCKQNIYVEVKLQINIILYNLQIIDMNSLTMKKPEMLTLIKQDAKRP